VVEEEQASRVFEEKQSLPLPHRKAGSSPSYSGSSSSDDDYEINLEDKEDAVTTIP
jgi:hypothetical protein